MIPRLLCWKGFAVNYYSFTLSALHLRHPRLSLIRVYTMTPDQLSLGLGMSLNSGAKVLSTTTA